MGRSRGEGGGGNQTIVPLHTIVMLTVFFVMTSGSVVPLTTPSHKSLKLVSLYKY